MAAGCGPCSGGGVAAVQMVAMSQSYPRMDGTYSLYSYQDCEGGHHGAYEGLSIYVVARNMPSERLFSNEELAEASDYMNTLEPRNMIEKITASALCDQAVRDVYAR